MRISSWDTDYCFHIDDFQPNDSLIVWHHKKRERGEVVSADHGSMVIYYKAADNNIYTAILDDIIFLDDPKVGWLDS